MPLQVGPAETASWPVSIESGMPEGLSLSHSPCNKWNKVRIDADDNDKGARLHRPEQNLLSVHVTQALHQPDKLWRYTSPFEQARAVKAEQEELSKIR